jgi:hypothetical protein
MLRAYIILAAAFGQHFPVRSLDIQDASETAAQGNASGGNRYCDLRDMRRRAGMGTRLIIDGNSVYEIDEDCIECRKHAKDAEGRVVKQEKMQNSVQQMKRDRKTSGKLQEDKKCQ